MAYRTTNYGLIKPIPEEFYDVNVQNENMDIIDEKLKEIEESAVNISPESIGAVTKEEVETAIEDHVNSENPHGVTCGQIGAVSIYEKGAKNGIPTLGSDGKIPSGQLPSMNYIPTSQKGAANGVASLGSDGKVPSGQLPEMDYAPDGFGLGETAVEIDSWNNAKANGYYYSNADAPNAFVWYGHVVVSSGNDVLVQTVYSNINGLVHRCIRRRLGGTFGDWEWDNPPLSGSTEYRTTERINGKAVYKRGNSSGVIEYRLDGETTWKKYLNTENWTFTLEDGSTVTKAVYVG